MTGNEMTTETKLSFSEALQNFLKVAQTKVDERFKDYAPQSGRIEFQEGPKYVRVLVRNGYNGVYNKDGASAYCFVEKETGNIYKPAGWKAPERKNPRSNIYSADCGASGVTGYGTIYLR